MRLAPRRPATPVTATPATITTAVAAASATITGLFAALSAFKNAFDGAYDYYVAKIQQRFALFVNFFEQIFLAGLIVRGLAGFVGLCGLGARALHVGNLNAYVYWFLFGLVALWLLATGVL